MRMKDYATYKHELKQLMVLSVPVMLSMIGTMLIGFVDVLMVTRIGTLELGGASIGSVWINGTSVFGVGLMMGMDPILSRAFGANDRRALALTFQRGIILALVFSIPLSVSWAYGARCLSRLGQAPAVTAVAHRYVTIQIASVVPMMLFFACRQYLQGMSITMPVTIIMLVANVFNYIANSVLIFGVGSFAGLGFDGAALASTVTRFFMFFALLVVIWWRRLFDGYWLPWSRAVWQRDAFVKITRFGLQTGFQYGLEGWAFQMAILMSGWVSTAALGAHSFVQNIISLTFMIPFGLSMGACTRVGTLIGAGDTEAAGRTINVSLVAAALLMVPIAVVFVVGRELIPAMMMTDDREVIAIAAGIFPIAAAFQLVDGVQVVGGGIMRGIEKHRLMIGFNILGYWLLAMPIASYCIRTLGHGVQTIWWALFIALSLVALLLMIYLHRYTNTLVES